uniref:Uncharacterized protein n=1 Tax=Rhizophora mucronata TaxID=61149 RepID=A0A2P2P573_RHIMU
MAFWIHRGIILVLCVGTLFLQPEKVSGITSIDLALRWNHGMLSFAQNSRLLKTVALEDLQTMVSQAPVPSMAFDPTQSNKRTVRRGSDPIHNRC